MGSLRPSRGHALVVALTVAALTVSLSARQAQDPRIGTWKLNLAKSSFSPGPAPKAQTLTYKAEAKGLTALLQGTDAEGRPINPDVTNLIIIFDGRDHPTPTASYDASAWKRLDANSYEVVRKKNGKIVLTSTNVVSKDGQTMTITTKGIEPDGRPVNDVRVFEKVSS